MMAAAWLLAATAAAFIPASGAQGSRDATPSAHSFLQKAGESQRAEIVLGQLAAERAGDREVRQFASQMVEDHRKAGAEIQQLAAKEGVVLSTELTGKHKDKKDEFGRLSGREFDRAYMEYLLHDHRKDVKEFERRVKSINDPQVQHWAEGTLPLLKQHLRQARQIARSIGIPAAATR